MKTKLLILVLLVSLESGCIPKEAPDSDIVTGSEIAAAVEQYKVDTGHYPRELIDLTPKYLPEIKAPRFGQGRWEYRTYSDGSFGLFLEGRNSFERNYIYDRVTKRWKAIDESS